ncbi:MAG TPA: PIN domain-containing protein [Chloroflexota bacterium]|jgi:predicted nucleic acid-binding protein
MPPRFLDTNPILRYLTRDDEPKAEQTLALLQRMERGEERVRSNTIVIFEVVYALQSYYRVPKPRIRELLLPIVSLRGLQLPNKGLLYRALDLYVERNLPFADAYNAVEMLSRGESEIYTWDTDFNRIEGVSPVAPGG